MNILLRGGLIITLLFAGMTGRTQTYYAVTHTSGTQNVNGVNVTVTPAGVGALSNGWCGEAPYWIGAWTGTSSFPGSYSFSFGTPVSRVRIRLTAMDIGEVISFVVNGVPYTLSTVNLFTFLGTCNQAQAAIVGGNLIGTATSPPTASGGEVNISESISSITFAANGVMNGTVFSLSFTAIDVYSNGPVCQGDILKLFVVPDIAGATYSWTGPGGFSANVQNPVIPVATMAQEGMYKVTRTIATDTLTDSTYVTIMPTPVTAIVYDEPVCAGKDLVLTDTTTLPGVGYQWKGPNGFNASIANPPVIPNVQPLHSGVYTLTTTLGECAYTATATIHVLQPSQYSSTEVICSDKQFDFNGRWLNEPGTYRDTLLSANGCDSIVTLNLVVLPVSEISISVNQGTMPLCMGDSVLGEATGARSYYWYSNDRLVDSSDRAYIYLSDFANKVMVVGRSDNGCHDTAEAVINVNACCGLFIPNAFSPNGDGINDEFAAVPHGNVRGYRMQLFNRWGQVVFSAFDVYQQWDGTYHGIPADAGTYFYYISAECLEGTELSRKGEVTLIR